ncbi:MAG: chemotaxis protein CheA [Pseudomonadota bacterium]
MNEDDIQKIFFVECEESLEAAEMGLDECKAGTHDGETINAIFRAVHSIKGGAGAFGHEAMQAYTHCFENLLGDIREDVVELNDDLVNLLLLALDCLRDHVEAARNAGTKPDDAQLMSQLEAARSGNTQPSVDQKAVQSGSAQTAVGNAADGLDDLDSLLDELTAEPPSPEPPSEPIDSESDGTTIEPSHWRVHIRPHSGGMSNGSEPLLWLRELTEMGGQCETCLTSDIPQLHELDVEEGYLGWTFRMPGSVSEDEVADIFDFAGDDVSISFGDDAEVPAAQIANAEPEPDTTQEAAPASNQPPTTQTETNDQNSKSEDPAKSASPKPKAAASPSSVAASKKPAAGSQSVRIDLSKLDALIDGVGELVIAQAMLTQRLANENCEHIEELAMLDSLVRDVQEHAMAFRAQPISAVFGRVPRLLRELAGNTGKHVKLEVTGETTELDKTVIERLSEPMTHLIRNAVDHGIEPVEERQASGKDPEGTLTLAAEQKAGRIIIQISDDGRGINRDKLRDKALSNGLISEDTQLSDEEIYQLVFSPGLSTAQEVSNISGRGVGMDVVKQNVKDLGGRITIDSTPGVGTTFTLALPLTLAISDGMIVQVGDQSLVIPLAHVIESLRPNEGDLKGMGTNRKMLNVRGQFLPVIPLGAMTGADNYEHDPHKGVLVIVDSEGFGQAALMVDAISDQRQFVIKSLDAHYRTVDSVAGATILGNGQVALIVDVDYLIQSSSTANAVAAVA